MGRLVPLIVRVVSVVLLNLVSSQIVSVDFFCVVKTTRGKIKVSRKN